LIIKILSNFFKNLQSIKSQNKMDEFKAKRFVIDEGISDIQKLVISRNILKG